MDMIGVRAVIRGRVQGVGFRFFALREGAALGLSGWVRNRADGSVEALAEGPAAAVEEFLNRLRQGPPGAGVTAVEEERIGARGSQTGFRVRPSL